jgi:phospholipase C
MAHDHDAFATMCDLQRIFNYSYCLMDGAAAVKCDGKCPPMPAFYYISNADGALDPYLALATQYGWANYMYQTNQGPSYPAHQFLFGATSAPSAADDSAGIFASENLYDAVQALASGAIGCAAPSTARVQLIAPGVGESPSNIVFPCFEHQTLGDVISAAQFSWRYYAPSQNSIWTAPNSIAHICEAQNRRCTGSIWRDHLDLKPSDVLTDIARCKLRNVSWVIPTGQNSDHSQINNGGGPSWVASIVNAIGNSSCRNAFGKPYWETTAIIILWDDWGGWYDHVSPQVRSGAEGDYQLGFRVPLIFVSAYTPRGYIDNNQNDFGSIARFIEGNFSVPQGSLGFADARSTTDLSGFYDLSSTPRAFTTIPAPLGAAHFIHDTSPPLPPDND